MKKSVFVLMAVLLFQVSAFSQCIKDMYSELSYPISFNNWIMGEIKDLEIKYPGFGTMADYDLDKLHVSLYFYDRGLESVNFSDVEDDYKEFSTELKKFEEQGIYSAYVAPVKGADIFLNDGARVLNAFFEFTIKGTAYSSFYFNTAMKNQLVKVRFSVPKTMLEEKKSAAFDFVKELYKRVSECKWTVLNELKYLNFEN